MRLRASLTVTLYVRTDVDANWTAVLLNITKLAARMLFRYYETDNEILKRYANSQ
jgi:hypothetical protein